VRIDIRLRDVEAADVAIFFEHQRDPGASEMAGLYPRDDETFSAHWARLLLDDNSKKKVIEIDGRVAGQVLSFDSRGEREVGYWLGREYWGKGIATIALSTFLTYETARPVAALAQQRGSTIIVVDEALSRLPSAFGAVILRNAHWRPDVAPNGPRNWHDGTRADDRSAAGE
jgi:hypothetical protein